MREILFKAKRIDNGEWIESMTICKGTIKRKRDLFYFEVSEDKYFQVNPKTVCQFTGLLDKNGKKIFEGDKLECSDSYTDEPYQTTVRFKDGGFLVDAQGCDYDITCIGFLDDEIELEIIGNIHDNETFKSE